jgi:hypothetical protein
LRNNLAPQNLNVKQKSENEFAPQKLTVFPLTIWRHKFKLKRLQSETIRATNFKTYRYWSDPPTNSNFIKLLTLNKSTPPPQSIQKWISSNNFYCFIIPLWCCTPVEGSKSS